MRRGERGGGVEGEGEEREEEEEVFWESEGGEGERLSSLSLS